MLLYRHPVRQLIRKSFIRKSLIYSSIARGLIAIAIVLVFVSQVDYTCIYSLYLAVDLLYYLSCYNSANLGCILALGCLQEAQATYILAANLVSYLAPI